MANFGNYPAQYQILNKQLSKQLVIVMVIEGIPYTFGAADVYQTVRYGDPGIVYGLPGLVYGGLRRIGGPNGVGGVKSYIQLDPSMIIQQRIEPEQGKGSVGLITMTLIDYHGEISYMIAPGNVVDEIMCSKQVTIYIGFQQSSFPEDYVILYRGYITSLDCPPGLVKFQISDGTMKSRQPIFSTPTTNLNGAIDDSQTSITVFNTAGFYAQIQGPDGSYSTKVHTYIIIDNEIMQYSHSGIPDDNHFTVTRGALGTLAVAHDDGTPVSNSIQFGFELPGQGISTFLLALQLLLSGWNGPCETDVNLSNIGFITTPVSNAFTLADQDALLGLGLTVGDWFTISGAINGGNDLTGQITSFEAQNGFTTIIYTDQTFPTPEPSTTGKASFRSKYDVLPLASGSKCRMRDVDVAGIENVFFKYFRSSIYDLSIYFDTPVFAKDIIATELMLPIGCYQISKFGRVSISVTKPPLPGVGNLTQLDYTNVIDPERIHVTRSTNNRTFYNQISYEFDYDIINQVFNSVNYAVDTDSLNLFQQTLTLPIQSKGLRSIFGGASVVSRRGQALLNRYKNVALMIELTCNWSAGSLIEVSDIILLVDNGNLKIMNFATGERNLGSQLFEVIDRSYNVTQGNVKLKLLSGLGFDVNSRFGLIAPSTILSTACTTTRLRLTPSYGQTSIGNELAKWTPFFGLPILVHSDDYSVVGTSVLQSIDSSDPTALSISPALGFTPSAGYILEIANYPTSTNKNENSQYKALYCYITPSVNIVSGTSSTQFTVGSGDISKFMVGQLMIVRKNDWSVYSQEVTITNVNLLTYLVTVSPALKDQVLGTPFTPNSSYYAEGLGFPDGTGYYRYD